LHHVRGDNLVQNIVIPFMFKTLNENKSKLPKIETKTKLNH